MICDWKIVVAFVLNERKHTDVDSEVDELIFIQRLILALFKATQLRKSY